MSKTIGEKAQRKLITLYEQDIKKIKDLAFWFNTTESEAVRKALNEFHDIQEAIRGPRGKKN